MKIAWIGVGVMGESLVKHLINAGHELYVYNRTASKCDSVVSLGAIRLDKIEDAPLYADVIFTIVGYPKDVEEVYLGENGLIKNAKSGQIFIDMTTSSPEIAKNITEKFSEVGAYALDIPVTGGDIGARNGTLTLFVGGDKEIFETKVRSLVETFSKTIAYFGDGGKGQYAKLGNQIAIAATMISLAESYVFAKATGLDVEEFLATISTGSAGSFSMTSYGPRVLKGDFKPGFYTHHFIKDMKLALEECDKCNIKLPGLELAYKMYSDLSEEIRFNEGTQAIIKCY